MNTQGKLKIQYSNFLIMMQQLCQNPKTADPQEV